MLNIDIKKISLTATDKALKLAAKLPYPSYAFILQKAFNKALQRRISEGDFDILEGRCLCVKVTDLKLSWYLTVEQQQLKVITPCSADVTISGNWQDLLILAARQEDPDTLFFRRRLVIEGDTELGVGVKNLLDRLDPDDLPKHLWQVIQRAGVWVNQQQAS